MYIFTCTCAFELWSHPSKFLLINDKWNAIVLLNLLLTICMWYSTLSNICFHPQITANFTELWKSPIWGEGVGSANRQNWGFAWDQKCPGISWGKHGFKGFRAWNSRAFCKQTCPKLWQLIHLHLACMHVNLDCPSNNPYFGWNVVQKSHESEVLNPPFWPVKFGLLPFFILTVHSVSATWMVRSCYLQVLGPVFHLQ